METRLEDDLGKLERLAYHRLEYSRSDIERYHTLRGKLGAEALVVFENLYRWMFVPITLWPINIQDVFAICLDNLAAGQPLPSDLQLLLDVLADPPDPRVCEVVASHEHDVQQGEYEKLVTTTAKFDGEELEIRRNPDLNRDWQRIQATWDLALYRDNKGMLRRTIGAERNWRPSFSVGWDTDKQRFQAVFDAFCFRWNLYGMVWDKPLLLKLSVNLTPQGTMIFIPAYWSFNNKLDVRWKAVMTLHRARAGKKQGAGISERKEARRKEAKLLHKLDLEAKEQGLKGEARQKYLCSGLGFSVETDPKRFRDLRKEFPL